MANGLDGGNGTPVRQRVEGEARVEPVLVTIQPQKMGVLNVTPMGPQEKRVDLVTNGTAHQTTQRAVYRNI